MPDRLRRCRRIVLAVEHPCEGKHMVAYLILRLDEGPKSDDSSYSPAIILQVYDDIGLKLFQAQPKVSQKSVPSQAQIIPNSAHSQPEAEQKFSKSQSKFDQFGQRLSQKLGTRQPKVGPQPTKNRPSVHLKSAQSWFKVGPKSIQSRPRVHPKQA